MKIAFLNGSLEPGRDGVGDYTRSLAQECVRQGHECCLIALNDRWLTEPERADENGIITLRMPAALDWTERGRLAKEALNAFQPDWISLQFVPYSFHPKGIVYGLAAKLRPLTESAKLHIMFHELWIGHGSTAGLKEKIIGRVQRYYIVGLIKSLEPKVLHTSNATYVSLLAHEKISASRLPLFGNIPVLHSRGEDWIFPRIKALGTEINQDNRSRFWLFALFGALHPGWSPEPLFSLLCSAAERGQRRVILLSIGNMGAGEAKWNEWRQRYSAQIVFVNFGQQTSKNISEFLNTVDYGIATSPYFLIEKSGAAAAMIEHGLPIIVSPNEEAKASLMDLEAKNCFYETNQDLEDKLLKGLARAPVHSRLASVTAHFLDQLQ